MLAVTALWSRFGELLHQLQSLTTIGCFHFCRSGGRESNRERILILYLPSNNVMLREYIDLKSSSIMKQEHQLDYECLTGEMPKTLQMQPKRSVEVPETKINEQTCMKLTNKTCLEILLPEAKSWHIIGILLGASESNLEQIEADYPGDCQGA